MKTNLLKLTAFLLILSGVISSCKDKENLFLEIDEAAIPAIAGAGTYSIAVNSNDRWTAVVEDAENHTWCTLVNASGVNDGIITVNIAENPLFTARSATIEIALKNLTKRVQFDQEAVKPCDCIMDTLRGEWSWFKTRGWSVGGSQDNEFKSIVKILSQNEDASINYEVFVADTLFYEGSFQFQHSQWTMKAINIKLPHRNPVDWAIFFEDMQAENDVLVFVVPATDANSYYYKKKLK